MADLKWSEPKLLVSKRQIDRILHGESKMIDKPTSDVVVQKNNSNFAEKQKLNKVQLDQKCTFE